MILRRLRRFAGKPWLQKRAAIRATLAATIFRLRELPGSTLIAVRYVWHVKAQRKEFVALVRLGGLGDLVCVLASIPGLRERHPNSWLVLIAPLGCGRIAASSGLADVTADRDTFLHRLVERSCPTSSRYQPLLPDEYSPRKPQTLHLADEFAHALGVDADLSSVGLRAPRDVRRRIVRRLREVNPDGRPVIVLHPGPTWAVREWPAEQWQGLIDLISRSFSTVMIKIGVDSGRTGRLRSLACMPDVVDWTNSLDVSETVALLEEVDALVGVDSGPLHVAGLLGLPAVGLFGPVSSNLRLHPRSRVNVVTGNVACLGCHHTPNGQLHWQSGCPHNVECMRGISAEAAFAALKRLQFLKSSPPRTCH